MVVSLAMRWRHLLFENWPVDSELLAAHLPERLDVDEYDDTGWLSVVPFANLNIRPAGFPAGFGLPLPELNLRTYVTCDGEPGVYFFSLDAQGLLSVLGARLFQHLPYYYARTSLNWADGRVQFRSRRLHPGDRPVHYEASYWPTGEPFSSTEDPLAQFLVERYRFYTQASDGSIRYANVDHEPWTLYPAASEVSTNTLFEANGFATPNSEPVSYYSPGLEVTASASNQWTTE
jgi:uncharacterized protein YqjF (DUF2071 family)